MKGIKVALALVVLASCKLHAADNITFSGTMRAEACTLHPDDDAIRITLSDTGVANLYRYGSTPDKRFIIRLVNCQPGVAHEVQVTFLGNQSTGLPGALAPDAGSSASGFAIALKNAAGQPLKLGDASSSWINGPDATLTFYHLIQAEPDAVANRTIVAGSFTASGTFTLVYP